MHQSLFIIALHLCHCRVCRLLQFSLFSHCVHRNTLHQVWLSCFWFSICCTHLCIQCSWQTFIWYDELDLGHCLLVILSFLQSAWLSNCLFHHEACWTCVLIHWSFHVKCGLPAYLFSQVISGNLTADWNLWLYLSLKPAFEPVSGLCSLTDPLQICILTMFFTLLPYIVY